MTGLGDWERRFDAFSPTLTSDVNIGVDCSSTVGQLGLVCPRSLMKSAADRIS